MNLLAAVCIASATHAQPADFIAYATLKHGHAKYHVVTADLNSGMVTGGAVHAKRLTSIWTLVKQDQPLAAITGTFFDPRSQRPVADVLIDGALVAKGSRGTALGVNYFGEVKIFDKPFKSAVDWSDYRYGIRGAVRVVSNGSVQPNPKAQKFKDSRIWGKASRTGVGLTKNGKLVLVATVNQVTLRELGYAMKKLGVKEGLSFDGGGSTALYYKGSLVIPPKRKLNNLFTLRPSEFAESLNALSR